jgi:probable rRNA maturation factor
MSGPRTTRARRSKVAPFEIDMAVEGGAWDDPGALEALARRAFAAAFSVASDRPRGEVEIGLLFTDDDGIRALNRDWRGTDKPTNVLSFPAPAQPGAPGPRPLGDIAVAFETVAREAEEEGKLFDDHLSHLLVHGLLHLLGYDHALEAEAEIMEGLEVRALATLGIADPYRDMAA